MSTSKVWLITGASSGFGRSMTEHVLLQGDKVVATLRKPEMLDDLAARYPKNKLLVLKVDVSKGEEIDHAFAKTKEVFGRLDVVFNNAGYGVFGEVESTPAEDARAMFDVNFWGASHVSRAAVQFFREVNESGRGGVLLQNSSLAGFVTPPGISYYSASKHALNGFSEGLAHELDPTWNIKICIIEPGGFYTSGLDKMKTYATHPAYNGKTSPAAIVHAAITTGTPEGDANKFSKAVYRLANGDNIPLHLPMGQDALAMLQDRVEKLSAIVPEVAPWSADLKRDDLGAGEVAKVLIPA
ncbi:hypothetical protein HYDPIDRAFT_159481 [Hydnomerulius pinastri MD-312]|uniref:NAD(P)-binding protein n=1 Tax=Hydnomerulius pinastri MD-312 TaxID=994086 RepID=A0A0C9W4M4_9AGAM|nr:hypothetical protein HYDPIDRAFT_159481 [Hydnomerulius pinastri MD-312]